MDSEVNQAPIIGRVTPKSQKPVARHFFTMRRTRLVVRESSPKLKNSPRRLLAQEPKGVLYFQLGTTEDER